MAHESERACPEGLANVLNAASITVPGATNPTAWRDGLVNIGAMAWRDGLVNIGAMAWRDGLA